MLLRLCTLVPAVSALIAADLPLKRIEDFNTAWPASRWATAETRVSAVEVDGNRVNEVTVRYHGRDFQWSGIAPLEPLVIPGKAQHLSLRVKANAGVPIVVNYVDGWGRSKVDGKDLKWEFVASGEWQEARHDIPTTTIFPITVTGVGTHNWPTKNQASESVLSIDHLGAATDVSAVDPETGALAGWTGDPANDKAVEPRAPLLSVAVSSPAIAHAFAGEAVRFTVTLRSWRPQAVAGTLTWTVNDWQGQAIASGTVATELDGMDETSIVPAITAFGPYRLATTLTVGDATVFSDDIGFVHLPKPIELSAEEHARSPYGLNVHGGRHVLVEPFARAGIRWYRDYAFNFDWLKNSKGADRSFTGWPNHRAIIDAYASRGLGFLACVMKTIPRPAKDAAPNSLPAPDREWKSHLLDVFQAFPEIRYWEVDNEYDLGADNFAYEKTVDWAHYRAYHKAFAETLAFIDDQAVTVENGRAGIWPDLAKDCIDSGDFAKVGVINIHHYCGAEAPEANIGNHNTNYTDVFANRQRPALFVDRMRETVDVAQADGVQRQVWLTEFGWDDLAGPKVPTAIKTAYLPRGYLGTLEAGIDKAFWFFDLSSAPEKAGTFFDGCGLLDHRQHAVPALAAMAGMTQALPAPRFLGDLRLGEQIDGMVFTSRGKRVAVLWTIDGSPATIAVKAETALDLFANPLPAGPLALSNRPVYAIGLADDEPLLRQIPYRLTSPGYVEVAGGDECIVSIAINNDRQTPIIGTITPRLPAGWTVTGELGYHVAPGASTTLRIPVSVPRDQAMGEVKLVFTAQEGAERIKDIHVRAFTVTPLAIQVSALEGEPGATSLKVTVLNQSNRNTDGTLTLNLPASWSTASTSIAIGTLASQELRTLDIPLTWSIDIKPGETASIAAQAGTLPAIVTPIIPSHRQLLNADAITIDGDLSDWPAATRIDPWMLGLKGIAKDADIHAGWRTDGLAIAIDVRNSELRVTNPRTFWEGELLEVFLATGADLGKRSWKASDHQFWMTPLVNEGRAYLGRWNRGADNPPTAYDLPGMVSKVVRTEHGYRLEAIIPAAVIDGWDPAPGRRYGIVIALTAFGHDSKREVFWPRSKDDGTGAQPGLWGVWHLR